MHFKIDYMYTHVNDIITKYNYITLVFDAGFSSSEVLINKSWDWFYL